MPTVCETLLYGLTEKEMNVNDDSEINKYQAMHSQEPKTIKYHFSFILILSNMENLVRMMV